MTWGHVWYRQHQRDAPVVPSNSLCSLWVTAISWDSVHHPPVREASSWSWERPVNGMQPKANACFPLEVLLFLLLLWKDLIQMTLKSAELGSHEADLDQRLRLFCGNSCMPSQTKRVTTCLHHASCLVWTEGTNLSNRQTSGHEPKDWQERWDDPVGQAIMVPIRLLGKPVFSYAVGAVAVMYPDQFNAGKAGEGSAQPCLHHGPRAGTLHTWDANEMLQPQ